MISIFYLVPNSDYTEPKSAKAAIEQQPRSTAQADQMQATAEGVWLHPYAH